MDQTISVIERIELPLLGLYTLHPVLNHDYTHLPSN